MDCNFKKIGILGGTFDPVHMVHLLLAETAYECCGLDKVLMMPSPDPYYRTDKKVSLFNDRAEMLKAAISDNPHLEFSDFEVALPGPTFTVNTLRKFKESFPDCELFFIVGGDSLFSIENWKEPEEIFKLATIVSSKREKEFNGESGVGRADSNLNLKKAESLQDEFEIQSDYLRKKYGANIVDVKVPNVAISSSDIIKRISAGLSVKYYLPERVIEYIKENHLYGYKEV